MNIFNSWIVKQPIAHRGLHNQSVPENSLLAFSNAIDHNYAIEIDVRPIDDGTVVVFHDSNLCRLTKKDGYISSLSLEELKSLRLGGTEECIPTLREVLEFVNGRAPLLIEIKNDGKVGAFEQNVASILKEYKGEFAIQSFNPYALEYFRVHMPNVWRGQLASFFKTENLGRLRTFVLKRMLLNQSVARPHFIAYNFSDLPNRFVNRYKGKAPILAWTIRSNDDLEQVKGHCDNIIFEGFEPVFE